MSNCLVHRIKVHVQNLQATLEKNPQNKRPRRNHSATYLVYRKYIFDNGTTYLNSILVSLVSKSISDVLQTRHIETKTKNNPLSIHR